MLPGYRVGVPRKGFFDDLQPEVAACVEEALAVIKTMVAQVADVGLNAGAHRTIFNAEIYEYHEAMVTKHPELYQPHTLPRVLKCAGISATDYIRDWRNLVEEERSKAEELFQQVDVVITPTVPVAAPRISDLEALGINELRPFETKYLLRNTSPFSVLFWPSVSVSVRFHGRRFAGGIADFRQARSRCDRAATRSCSMSRQRSGISACRIVKTAVHQKSFTTEGTEITEKT